MGPRNDSLNMSNWSTQLRKGLLELCIVNIVGQGDIYGYDLVKRLASVQGLVVSEGTVYPLLSRLRTGGILKTYLQEYESGPARKYYSLTPEGKKFLGLMNRHWAHLIEGVSGLINGKAI